MSSILIRSVNIADPEGALNGKTLDLLLVNGRLEKAEKNISDKADLELNAEGYTISPGWIDAFAVCGEPGEEWKEDIASLASAASAGGFTEVAAFCGCHPVPDSAAAISGIQKKSAGLPVNIMPVGTATKGRNGKEIAEIFDMRSHGAVAFSDGDKPLEDSGLRSRVMEYAANSKAPFLDFPFDPSLALHGTMHDGIQSNSMGLKGIPAISETNKVAESIQLAKWLKTPLRFLGISCAESVEWIRKAKKEGVEIYAAVPVMNLLLTDEDLAGFDENCKVLPPLRTTSDREALIQGLKDGTLDAIYSNHVAQDAENKDVEFEYAAFGANNIQAVFGMVISAFGNETGAGFLVDKLHCGPAKLLGIPVAHMEIGSVVNCTVFKNSGTWNWNAQTNKSKSKNSPFFGRELPGTIMGTICNGKWCQSSSPSTM